MNWIDIILLVLLVAAVIVGSKKGLIRELMALAVLAATVIVSINYIDSIAIVVFEQLGGSPLVTGILSFIILLAIIYAVFKLLAIFFYKVANLHKLGKKRSGWRSFCRSNKRLDRRQFSDISGFSFSDA